MNSGSSVEELEATLLKKRIELIRDKREMLKVDAALEQVKTEAAYESQMLKILIASTKPLDRQESKAERDHSIAALNQESTAIVFKSVKRSVSHQNLIYDSVDEMMRNLDIFFIDQEQRQQSRIKLLNDKFDNYVSALQAVVSSSEDKLKHVTSQYLVLRHNARIAREVLLQKQHKLEKEKENLIKSINQMREDVDIQLSSAEEKIEGEMNSVISQRRSDVLRREEELEHDWAEFEEFRNFHTNDSNNLRKKEKLMKKKFKELSTQRLRDLKRIESELKILRQETHMAELQFLRPSSQSNQEDLSHIRVNTLSEKDIMKLNNRLIELKIALENNFEI